MHIHDHHTGAAAQPDSKAEKISPARIGARRAGLPDHGKRLPRHPGPWIDFKEVNAVALENMPAVLQRVAPDGEYRGGEYVMRNPHRDDQNLGSFKVNVRTGRWSDFATGAKGSDIISLIAFLLGQRHVEAARNLAQMLGVAGGQRNHG
jgi:hypothetical protein